jgi:hypothetical protein
VKDLPNDCFVTVSKEAGHGFLGRVIGIAQTEQPVVGRLMIVECMDGSIPNSTYPYRALSVPEIFLTRL